MNDSMGASPCGDRAATAAQPSQQEAVSGKAGIPSAGAVNAALRADCIALASSEVVAHCEGCGAWLLPDDDYVSNEDVSGCWAAMTDLPSKRERPCYAYRVGKVVCGGDPTSELHDALWHLCKQTAASAYVEVLRAGQVKRRTARWGIPRETYSHEYADAAHDGVWGYLWPELQKFAQAMSAGTAATAGRGAKPASAVAESHAPESPQP